MESIVDLPSKGLPYTGIDISKVTIRSLRGRDEKLLAELTAENVEKKHVALLKNVVTGINPEELTLGDRSWMLLWLRANSYSPIIKSSIICEACSQKISVDIDLTKITFKELAEDYKEPYSITLSDGSSLPLRLLRIGDEIKISEFEAKFGKEEGSLYRIALSIANGETPKKNMELLEDMESIDTQKIKSFHYKFIHGPELDNIQYSCPKCGLDEGVLIMPFRPDFLIPSYDSVI